MVYFGGVRTFRIMLGICRTTPSARTSCNPTRTTFPPQTFNQYRRSILSWFAYPGRNWYFRRYHISSSPRRVWYWSWWGLFLLNVLKMKNSCFLKQVKLGHHWIVVSQVPTHINLHHQLQKQMRQLWSWNGWWIPYVAKQETQRLKSQRKCRLDGHTMTDVNVALYKCVVRLEEEQAQSPLTLTFPTGIT